MKLMLIVGFVFVLGAAISRSASAELKVGDAAPEFSLPGSDGKTYKLSDFNGKKAVVLAWFPKAFTGGCTKECKSFKENGELLKKLDVAYFTASCDTPEDNAKFAKSLDLDYPILSDPGTDVAKAYGVSTPEKKNPTRWTYIIGKEGKILEIIKTVDTANHGADIAKKLKELGVSEKK